MEVTIVFSLIIVLTFHGIQAKDLLLGSIRDTSLVFIPCEDNTECDNLLNGECKNHFCECNGTKFCEDKIETVVTKIGEFCKISADCNIEHSICRENKCVCAESRVVAADERRCLKIAEELGSTCEESVQCYKKVPHSGCQNEKCVCHQQMHEYEGECYRNVGLGAKCKLPGECSATTFAKCIEEICTCKESYVQNNAANRCLELPSKISGPCYEDIQCSTMFGKAFCKQGHCHCEELFQFKFTRSMCVKDLLLGEICQNHTDCHGPEESESRSECILGVCKCRSEFYEEHGFCASGAISAVHVPSMLLFFVIVLCVYFNQNTFVVWGALVYGIFYMLWITFLGRYFTDNNNYMNSRHVKNK